MYQIRLTFVFILHLPLLKALMHHHFPEVGLRFQACPPPTSRQVRGCKREEAGGAE